MNIFAKLIKAADAVLFKKKKLEESNAYLRVIIADYQKHEGATVPVMQPIDRDSLNADIQELMYIDPNDRVWKAVLLVIAQVHANYVAKAEAGDVNSIFRARGVSSVMYALEHARRTGSALQDAYPSVRKEEK